MILASYGSLTIMQGIGALVIAAFCLPAACGQYLALGIRAGVPITEYFQTGLIGSGIRGDYADYSAATRRYTVGATAEWRPGQALSIEVDALYKRMGYVAINFMSTLGIASQSAVDVKGNSWEFPALAKYRFRSPWRLYIASGAVLRYVGPVRGRGQSVMTNYINSTSTQIAVDTSDPPELDRRLFPGVVGAGGIELPFGRFRLLPEVRYTHWLVNLPSAHLPLSFRSNQVEFLVGWLF